jgi:hypothetical protein
MIFLCCSLGGNRYFTPILHTSGAAGLKSGQSNLIKNLKKYNFIFLAGSTGWTGYSQTKQRNPSNPVNPV